MPVGWEHSFINSTKHFIDAYFAGQPPSLTGEEGREVLQFALAAQESARTGAGGQALRTLVSVVQDRNGIALHCANGRQGVNRHIILL